MTITEHASETERLRNREIERRTHVRFDLSSPEVAFCVLQPKDAEPMIARVVDVSAGGIRVVVPEDYAGSWPSLGDGLFPLHINFGGQRVIVAQIQVAWFGGVTKNQNTNLFSGMRFVELQPADREWLDVFLGRVPHGRAHR